MYRYFTKTKNLLTVAILLVFCAFTNITNAQTSWNISDNSSSGNNVTATLTLADSVLTISGTGNMADFLYSSTGIPWNSYITRIKTVIINNGVTNIGDIAFQGCTNLTWITIPEGVKIIGTRAFENCSSLAMIAIPSSVTEIEERAFRNCTALTAICNMATTPQIISNSNVFEGVILDKSKNLAVPTKSISTYQSTSVWNNFNITAPYVLIKGDLNDNFNAVIIGEDGFWYFYEYQDNNSNIPKRLTVYNGIENAVKFVTYFDNNGLPRKIISDDGLSILADGYNGNNVNVTITTNDGQSQSFSGIQANTNVKSTMSGWEKANSTISGLGCGLSVINVIFEPTQWNKLLTVFGCLGHINDVETSTGQVGFFPEKDANLILSINVLLTALDCGIAAYTGSPYHWVQCVVGTAGIFTTILSDVFDGTNINNCSNFGYSLSTSGTLAISDNAAFSCSPYPWNDKKSGIKTLVIGSGVTSIPYDAFLDCINLKEVKVDYGADPITFGANVFDISKAGYFGSFPSTSIETVYLNRNIYQYLVSSGRNSNPFAEITTLKNVNIGNNVTDINAYSFQNCTGLTNVTIPNNIKTLGIYAFDGCTGLTNISIGSGINSIPIYAFSGCTSLTSITIPSNITSVESSAFLDCTNLKEVKIDYGTDPIAFGGNVFDISKAGYFGSFPSTSIETVYLNRNIYQYLVNSGRNSYPFAEITTLKTLTIGDKVTTINDNSFQNCTGLTQITSNATIPPTLQSNTFYNVNKGIPVYINCNYLSAYQSAQQWNGFTNYQCAVQVVPASNSVAITFPKIDNAATYTLNIYGDENQTNSVKELHLDNNGNLKSVPVQNATTLSCTVSGLSANTRYFYSLTPYNASGIMLTVFTGEFTTTAAGSNIENIVADPMSIFPNPAKHEIFIKSELQIEKVEIYNQSGICVLKNENVTGKLDVSSLANGLYLARIFIDGTPTTKKIVIKK